LDVLKKNITIINGVNFKTLGTREIDIYGSLDFGTYFTSLQKKYTDCTLSYRQSDSVEGIVEALYAFQHEDAIILNPGAYTHTAIVLADAIKSISTKVIEVHISNLFGREEYRKRSCIASACHGFISGFGLKGYEMAILSVLI
jgi:3-dehydroquinate dehydratase-2